MRIAEYFIKKKKKKNFCTNEKKKGRKKLKKKKNVVKEIYQHMSDTFTRYIHAMNAQQKEKVIKRAHNNNIESVK